MAPVVRESESYDADSFSECEFSTCATPKLQMSAYECFLAGKRGLSKDGTIALKSKLHQNLHILTDRNEHDEDEQIDLNNVVLENWVDEILKFLTLKTVMNDVTEPCQLAPGFAISVGWESLIQIPSIYARVCQSMGNNLVFDYMTSMESKQEIKKHVKKRFNATLRAYQHHFDQQPPCLYWSLHERPKKRRKETIFDKLASVCVCNEISSGCHVDQRFSG